MQNTSERPDWKNRILNNPIWQLTAAGLAIVAVLIAVLIPRKATGKNAARAGSEPTVPTVTHTLSGAGRGSLSLVDAAHPQSREDATACGVDCLPAGWHAASGYAIGGASIRLAPLVLMQLDRMILDYTGGNANYSVPCVTSGYRDFATQSALGITPGTDPAGTGYALTLSLCVPQGDGMTVVPLSNPLAQSFSAWLASHAASYGFTYDSGGALRYVGVPHAFVMLRSSLSLSAYVSALTEKTQTAPLSVEAAGATYSVFFVPAEKDGTASVTLPESAVYTVSGTNAGGFVVAVREP